MVTGAASGIGPRPGARARGARLRAGAGGLNEARSRRDARPARARWGARSRPTVADVADRARMEQLPGEVLPRARPRARRGEQRGRVGHRARSPTSRSTTSPGSWGSTSGAWSTAASCSCRTCSPRTRAHIVNISSIFGFIGVPDADLLQRGEVRGARLPEALLSELSGTRVGVTCVHPGGIRTNIVRAVAHLDAARRGREDARRSTAVRALDARRRRPRARSCARSSATSRASGSAPRPTRSTG